LARRVALVTGAGGEMGHALLPRLAGSGLEIVALDLRALPEAAVARCAECVVGSVLEPGLVQDLVRRHAPEIVYHLAAVLSSKAEKEPDLAHRVNVDGTSSLMQLCAEEAARSGRPVRFLFPSSIAIYGLPDRKAKDAAGAVREDEWNAPSGMYGCNKLYGEIVGSYWTRRAERERAPGLDFRSIRFPGLISADTLPSGGTTDYAPEMIHAAGRGEPYACFVSADTRLPFMTMPDAVDALLRLASAPASALTTRVYNIGAFSPSAEQIRNAVLEHYPAASITFASDPRRQAIVDSWPEDVNDARARADWGHAPRHGLREALADYLIPSLARSSGAVENR
jgi:nucleoside-diphosphate-sugar epimerase